MRIAVTTTQVMYVDVPDDEEHRYLIENDEVPPDVTDLSEAAERFANIAGCEALAYSEGWISIERHDGPLPWCCEALDGTAPERRLWRARSILDDAVSLLGRTRYREGDCREVDAAMADLRRVDERLRVMALAAEGRGPDHKPLDGAAVPA